MYSRVSNNHTVSIKQKDNSRVFSIKLNVQRMIGMTLLDLTNKHGAKLVKINVRLLDTVKSSESECSKRVQQETNMQVAHDQPLLILVQSQQSQNHTRASFQIRRCAFCDVGDGVGPRSGS